MAVVSRRGNAAATQSQQDRATAGRTHQRTSNSWKKTGTEQRYRLFATYAFLAFCILAVIVFALPSSSGTRRIRRETTNHNNRYAPNISTELTFAESCPQQVQTYEINNGKVRWVPGSYSYERRGMSVHCLLTRAAKRLGPGFSTTLRIGLADVDLKTPLSFQPAADEATMGTSKAPLLFPDSTFESWPEVHDYSLAESVGSVNKAAKKFGLPGTPQWIKRDPRLAWRGSHNGNERQELINHTSPLLNVEAISYNMTHTGMKLTSSNQISRHEHCGYRFLLHMNGIFNNRYSSSVKWKLLCGSLVFVPTKPLFVEWWNYKAWEPFQHYVPYTSVDDLLQQLDYYSNHLDEAAEIAKRGKELAQSAFDNLDDFVDETLLRYAAVTNKMEQKPCERSKSKIKVESVPKSLEDLQTDYGPTVCA